MTSNMDTFLEKLDPKTRKRFQMAMDAETGKLPSASLEFNWATGGGFPIGDVSTLFGNPSSSKTALALATIGQLQKDGKTCAFISAENKFDKVWASKLGVDTSSLILINKRSFGAITDEVKPLLKYGLDFLVWDSISTTMPEAFVEEGESKEFDKQKQIGAASLSMGIALRDVHYTNERTTIVLISQTRTDMSGRYPMQKPTNGKAVEFYSSLIVKLSASPSEKEQIMDEVFIGDKVHELPVGREVKLEVTKNKVGPPNRTGKYNFYYDGSEVGIDNIAELVTMAKRFGVLAGSTWVSFGDQKWQGTAAVVKALKDDPDLYEAINKEVQMMITGEVPNEQLGELQEEGT